MNKNITVNTKVGFKQKDLVNLKRKKLLPTERFYILITMSLSISLLFSSCDFAYKKHITGNYYIVAIDTKKDATLSYALGSGNFVGKAPGRVLEYGYNDSVLIAKTIEYNKSPSYYIINMKKDFDAALEQDFRIGPITQNDYNQDWRPKLNIQLQQVEK